MPLVFPGGETVEEPRDERHARLRKIRPEFADGPLVTVAGVVALVYMVVFTIYGYLAA